MVSANIFVNQKKITGTTHIFEEKGIYTIIAKNELYLDSNPIELTVKEKEKEEYETNVYVVGWEWGNYGDVPKYWKNGVSIDLTNGLAHANAMEIVVVKERK